MNPWTGLGQRAPRVAPTEDNGVFKPGYFALKTFRTSGKARTLPGNPKAISNLVRRLTRSGLLERVGYGTYLTTQKGLEEIQRYERNKK